MAFPKDRKNLSLREIYDSKYVSETFDFDRFDELITHGSQELSIPAGKLRLSDRFDEELAPEWGNAWDSRVATLALDLKRGAKRHKRKLHEKVQTLDEYLRLMNELS